MATSLLKPTTQKGEGAICRYFGIVTDLAALDTIGITVVAAAFLHTVPTGGQTLDEALSALAALIGVDPLYAATYSPNSPFDMCLRVDNLDYDTEVAIVTPIYAVA